MEHRREPARAKINLTLHVGRIIADPYDAFYGYHPVDSLVAFADVGDAVSIQPSQQTQLTITGPFSGDLAAGEDNLVLRAYRAVAAHHDLPPLAITLEKNLPIASGIGGGSANAAAMLRLLSDVAPGADMQRIAPSLGADVPVCLISKTAHMTGIGEVIMPCPLPPSHAVLVNPGIGVSTARIFKAFDAGEPRETPRPQKPSGDMLSRAMDGRNDLESPAIVEAPVITEVLRQLASQPACQLARMSGSGATCFGLFSSQKDALRAENQIKQACPDWWCVATQLGTE